MQTRNRLLDDLARVAGSAAGVAAGLKDEVESRLRQQFERVLDGFELVDRDEFEAVKAMAAEARAENQRLAARIADLEAAQGGAKPPAQSQLPAQSHVLPDWQDGGAHHHGASQGGEKEQPGRPLKNIGRPRQAAVAFARFLWQPTAYCV